MRKFFRISTLAALALAATALTAQAQSAKSFGILAGADFSSWTGSDADGGSINDEFGLASLDKSSPIGFVGGFYANIPLSSSLAFEPELLYEGKGQGYDWTYTDVGGTISGDFKFSLGYIAIPLLLRYNFQESGGPYALIGPSVGFNTSCSMSGSGDEDLSDYLGTDCSDEAQSVVFGGVLGLGFQRAKFGIEGRYDMDFTNAFQEVDGYQPNMKNAAWEILIRYQFK